MGELLRHFFPTELFDLLPAFGDKVSAVGVIAHDFADGRFDRLLVMRIDIFNRIAADFRKRRGNGRLGPDRER